jgi:hypothetical protein
VLFLITEEFELLVALNNLKKVHGIIPFLMKGGVTVL